MIKTMRPGNEPMANKLSLGLVRRQTDMQGKVEAEKKKMKTSAEKTRSENRIEK